MDTWGFINSFGVFQTTYTTLFAPISPSAISWIGSIQVFLLFFVGTPAGWLSDGGHFRPVLLVGSLLQVVGLFCAAQATEFWQLLLAQGLCMGLGNGLVFCPSLAVVSTYFRRRKSLAIGIGMAGSASGGLIFPSMVRQLLPRVGFPWTMRAIACVQLASLAIVNLLMRPRLPPSKGKPVIDPSAFRDPVYCLYAASMFFNFFGVYFAFWYIASFARTEIHGQSFSYEESLNLLLILNGVGLVGRVLPNYISDRKAGPINTLLPMSTISGILCLCWIAVENRAGMYSWTVVYAITAAAVQSMSPAALSSLTEDLRLVGVRTGMVFTILLAGGGKDSQSTG
ncbi:MFS general substrate transporter [Pleurostoma richardsiae]|uniref:MFS general substrate transporter n=1 Tax=Pleurostoma richardsiae TaxID=41990 RepID=A0AA38S6Q3_9PEZI|nr:MFS general substrate transporter [Pleurostoma richardsiae]